ncbi:hypothetical protein [Rubrivirga sp. IMCC43871]|uniref:hypothetical protein n=1 Tax=Rubrivirga sp. IMCC43871 TaxID=3391575 RepID=UPI0039900C99
MRVLGLLVFICSCAPRVAVSDAPPALVLGTFADDYGSTYEITERTWDHDGYARYHIVRWRPDAGYLVARNDDANPTDGGRWTRIDWVRLDGMAPYVWAFCLSAYDAPTAAAAEATRTAQPNTPRTGCGGHPFSRMRRTAPDGP